MPRAYFAALPEFSKELGGRLLALVDRHYEDLPSLRPYQRARRVRQLYWGLPSSASPFDVTTVARMGDSGELSAINLNRLHHLGQRFLTMGVSEDFGWQPSVANGDTASQEEGILAGSVLEHEKRASNLEALRHKFNELALLDGWSYFAVRWDPAAGPKYDTDPDTGAAVYEGRLKVTVHEWWRVITDLERQDAHADWVILTEFVNKYDLAKKHPAHADRILNLQRENRHVLNWQREVRGYETAAEESPLVPVYTLFHKPTPSVPNGREVVFAEDLILRDGPSVYGEELPVYRVAAAEWHGTPFAVSILSDIVALQYSVNALVSTGFTNVINHGLTPIAVRKEANLTLSQLGGATLMEVEGNPREDIVPLNLVSSDTAVTNFAKILLDEMTTLTGMNAVALGRQEHQMPASLAALLDQKAREYAGFFVRGDRLAVTQLGTAILRCYKQFARAPRVLEVIAGEGRRYMLEGFTGQKLGSVSRVTVSVRSGMMSTPAGQMAFAEQLLSSGAFKDPQAMRLLTGLYQRGSLDSALQPVETADMLMLRENDMLARGEIPPVRSLDQHKQHILKHREVMANPALRMNQAVDEAVWAHVQEHIAALREIDPYLLVAIGEEPLPAIPGVPDPTMMPPGDAAAAMVGALPPGAPPPPDAIPPGGLAEQMAGAGPDMPVLPPLPQPPPGAPPPLQ